MKLHPPLADASLELGDLHVLGNEAVLTQIFSNFLGNAVTFIAPRVPIWAESLPSPI